MNPTILTQIAHVDPNAAPLSINEMIDVLNPVITSAIQGSYIPYLIGNTTPGADDNDKAWIELDSNGRPLSLKIYYSGKWRRIYNGMLGEIRAFSGDPTISTNWDTNWHGVIGSMYDGWQICNGKNGSPDLSDKFIVCATHYPTGGPWQSKVEGGQNSNYAATGGNANGQVTLQSTPGINQIDQIPRSPRPDLILQVRSDSTHGADDGDLYGPTHANNLYQRTVLAGDPGNPNANHPKVDPVDIVPPFIAYGFMIFQGY